MKLTFAQISQTVLGAVRIKEEADGIRLYRFTEEQEEMYKERSADYYKKTFATAGIKLCFKTDSKKIKLRVGVERGSSRQYFSFDVFVDGKYVDSLDNFTGVTLPQKYVSVELPCGEFSKEFELGCGEKTVTVYFPWSSCTVIKEASLDDGAYIKEVKPSKKLLAFGDSITHGYDALHSSNRYISKLAEALDAEEINKAIGGEVFWPALAQSKEDFCPDYITVAYGTNDWNHVTKDVFLRDCKDFYTALRKNYPAAKIFALAPIWRKDCTEQREFGAFEEVEKSIRESVKDIDNLTLIPCFEFVPKEEKYFADLFLHPNDKGFEHYAENIIRAVKECL